MAQNLRRRQRLEEEEQRAGSGTDRGVSDIDSDRAVVNEEHMRRRIGQDKVQKKRTTRKYCSISIIGAICCMNYEYFYKFKFFSLLRPLMLPCQGFPASGGIMLSGWINLLSITSSITISLRYTGVENINLMSL